MPVVMVHSVSSPAAKTVRSAVRTLKALAAEDDRGECEGDLQAFTTTPVQVFSGSTSYRRIVYATKPYFMSNMLSSWKGLPPKVVFLVRPGMVLRSYFDIVAQFAAAGRGCRVVFVGDLEPLSLSVYMSLLAGGFDRTEVRKLIDVEYLGVNDKWLDVCRHAIVPALRHPNVVGTRIPVAICRRLTGFERRHLRALTESGVSVQDLVGGESADLLERGYSVDLGAASDPQKYGRLFGARLRRLLLG
jgi:hypothetical protein